MNHAEEMARLKEEEKAILHARDQAIKKLAAVQKIFDDKLVETANQYVDQLKSPPKHVDTKEGGGGGGVTRPSYRARLFAAPLEEEDDDEDEIVKFYNRIISKVSLINYIYIFLSIVTSFYRTDFVDVKNPCCNMSNQCKDYYRCDVLRFLES